eukprot:g9145.t1
MDQRHQEPALTFLQLKFLFLRPRNEAEKADDEAFAGIQNVMVEQPDWDDDDADTAGFRSAKGSVADDDEKPEPMDVDEKAEGEKQAEEEMAPEGQGGGEQPEMAEEEKTTEETPAAADEEKKQEAAESMEIDLTGDDEEKKKEKEQPSAEKSKPPSVPEGSPKVGAAMLQTFW